MISVFDFKTYRSFLVRWMEKQPKQGYGLRSRLADVIGTKTGFVTQVFNEVADFSPEQGIQIAQWVGLNEAESQFFLLLLQRERAGNRDLKEHFGKQIERLLSEREKLSDQLKVKKVPSQLDQSIYFSSWVYSYIHVLLTCADHMRFETIVKQSGFPAVLVKKVLDFLVESGLAEETPKGFKTGEARMHLGTNSPNLLKHHLNWNLRAIQAMESDLTKGLHYTSVVSLSQGDLEKARELWVSTLGQFKELVRESKGEVVCGFTLNLFEVERAGGL